MLHFHSQGPPAGRGMLLWERESPSHLPRRYQGWQLDPIPSAGSTAAPQGALPSAELALQLPLYKTPSTPELWLWPFLGHRPLGETRPSFQEDSFVSTTFHTQSEGSWTPLSPPMGTSEASTRSPAVFSPALGSSFQTTIPEKPPQICIH